MQSNGSSPRTVRRPTGIEVRHGRGCRSLSGGSCNCEPTYRAWVYSKRDGKKIRRAFPTQAAAKAWRSDASGEVRRGTMKTPSRIRIDEAAEALIAGMEDGSVRARGSRTYKPSVIRSYATSIRKHLSPKLGDTRLSELTRTDVQSFADRLLADGHDPSTVRNILMPLRVIYRRAIRDGEVMVSPTSELELPAVEGRRDRITAPAEVELLVSALPKRDRAIWATAAYAGLRRGELRALRWQDVDLAKGVIRVERSYDEKGSIIEPKSRSGRRTVPLASVLRDYLVEHVALIGRREGLVFGTTPFNPFTPSNVRRRAAREWERANKKRGEKQLPLLDPIGLHECRHTFASLMIAAGVNAKALSEYMGHSSITITLDRYGHLMPGNELQAAELLDAYLSRADTRSRLAQLEPAGQP